MFSLLLSLNRDNWNFQTGNVMMVTVKEVTSRSELRTFVDFPNKLYRGNEFYVPQLVSADMDTLTPGKNKAFEVCEGKYWMAYDEKGRVVGRVAGIVNHRYNAKVGEKICRFSWIDFIDDKQVSAALFDQVTAYAREMGMDKLELQPFEMDIVRK